MVIRDMDADNVLNELARGLGKLMAEGRRLQALLALTQASPDAAVAGDDLAIRASIAELTDSVQIVVEALRLRLARLDVLLHES